MDMDTVNKRALLRLHAGSWSRRNSTRRWEFMCELREQGLSWDQMGARISRSGSTAQRLWRRGKLERAKLVPSAGLPPATPDLKGRYSDIEL